MYARPHSGHSVDKAFRSNQFGRLYDSSVCPAPAPIQSGLANLEAGEPKTGRPRRAGGSGKGGVRAPRSTRKISSGRPILDPKAARTNVGTQKTAAFGFLRAVEHAGTRVWAQAQHAVCAAPIPRTSAWTGARSGPEGGAPALVPKRPPKRRLCSCRHRRICRPRGRGRFLPHPNGRGYVLSRWPTLCFVPTGQAFPLLEERCVLTCSARRNASPRAQRSGQFLRMSCPSLIMRVFQRRGGCFLCHRPIWHKAAHEARNRIELPLAGKIVPRYFARHKDEKFRNHGSRLHPASASAGQSSAMTTLVGQTQYKSYRSSEGKRSGRR